MIRNFDDISTYEELSEIRPVRHGRWGEALANIAEGFGRGITRELLRSFEITRGELEETRYFMLLSLDLGRSEKTDFETVNALCDSVGQLINALGRTLKARLARFAEPRVTSHRSRVTGPH